MSHLKWNDCTKKFLKKASFLLISFFYQGIFVKIIFLLLTFVCCAYSIDPIQKIYQEAFDLQENNRSEKDDEELLYEFYSGKIETLDLEVLKDNPELVFRRSLAHYEMTTYFKSIPETLLHFVEIQRDVHFVMKHAGNPSKLFAAAQLKSNFLEQMLEAAPQNEDEFTAIYDEINDAILSQWASNPLASGKELRDDVFANLCANSQMRDSFFNFVLLSEEDPDVALGYITPNQMELIEVEEGEDGAYLLCQYEYNRTPYLKISVTVGL
jgi:hypothetical protein